MKKAPIRHTVKELQMHLATRVRLSRQFAGYTQQSLSQRIPVSYASIRKFERTGDISLKSLLEIATFLNEAEPFTTLFKNAEILETISPKLLKRPKRCKNGLYYSTRKMTERMYDEAME